MEEFEKFAVFMPHERFFAHTRGKERMLCFEGGGAGTEYLPQAFSISTITA